ncbi:MAG: membrane protein [Gemmatimonadota bacterium]
MAHVHLPREIPVRYLPRSRGADTLAGTLFVVGLLSFVIRLTQDPHGAWISYVTNWLFFTSISIGAVLLAVATWITKAKWNWSVRRVSQAMVAFLPISFVLLLPMVLMLRENYFPWIEMMASDPVVQKKAAYLNIPFLVSRNVAGLALLFGMALYFVYMAIRPDMGLSDKSEEDDAGRKAWRERLTQGWMGQEQEEVSSYKRMTTMAPAFVLVYALVMSIVVYDWAMSLEPHWFSTMFGPWFFMGAFWGGIAATVLWSLYLRTKHKDIEHAIGLQQRHDLGKLAFAFTVFWTYLFFSQYIVIWYGKLPWEQAWIVHRSEGAWGTYSALVILLCFVVPFTGLIGRKAKMKPALLALFATVILTGLWLERYGLVAPSLWHEGPVFTIWQPLIGLMFLGLWMGAVRWFLSTFPVIQLWQPMSDPESLEAEVTAGVGAD